MKRIFKTLFITWIYCATWQICEIILYGAVEHRVVDDIVMLFFMPVIYASTK